MWVLQHLFSASSFEHVPCIVKFPPLWETLKMSLLNYSILVQLLQLSKLQIILSVHVQVQPATREQTLKKLFCCLYFVQDVVPPHCAPATAFICSPQTFSPGIHTTATVIRVPLQLLLFCCISVCVSVCTFMLLSVSVCTRIKERASACELESSVGCKLVCVCVSEGQVSLWSSTN